jgi:UrcA family protein
MKSAIRQTLIALVLGSMSAMVSAGSPAGSSRTVAFADLDLTHPAGAAVLYRRIRTAALEVCPPLFDRDPSFTARSRSCVQDAIARAVNEVNAPSLTQYSGSASPSFTVAQR